MNKDSKIIVTGCQGMGGWAVIRHLMKNNYHNVMGIDKTDCDLLDQGKVKRFFEKHQPEYVFHLAAKVGGIYANDTQSADFIYENLLMQCNVINTAKEVGVKKLLFCGSACIYPKSTPQPIKEDYLLTSILEETNKAYAIAKIAGVIMTQMYRKQYDCNFISAMPTNLYGIGDNFHYTNSHVMPALLRKFHDAKINGRNEVEVWGTGNPKREFLFIDDLASGLVFLMNNYDGMEQVNIGTGRDIPIKDLIEIIRKVTNYKGNIVYNTSKPDGVYVRRLDVSKLTEMGWVAKTSLEEGIEKTYKWFINNYDIVRK